MPTYRMMSTQMTEDQAKKLFELQKQFDNNPLSFEN